MNDPPNNEWTDENEWLTTHEAAYRAGVVWRTIMRWLDDGRLPGAFKRPGGDWSIPTDELRKIVRYGKRKPWEQNDGPQQDDEIL